MSALPASDRRGSRTPKPLTPGTPGYQDEYPGLAERQVIRQQQEKDRTPQVSQINSRKGSGWPAGWLPAIMLAGLLAGPSARPRRHEHAHVPAKGSVTRRDQREPVARFTKATHTQIPSHCMQSTLYVEAQNNIKFLNMTAQAPQVCTRAQVPTPDANNTSIGAAQPGTIDRALASMVRQSLPVCERPQTTSPTQDPIAEPDMQQQNQGQQQMQHGVLHDQQQQVLQQQQQQQYDADEQQIAQLQRMLLAIHMAKNIYMKFM